MINVLDLEYVIVGGGMAQMGDLLLDPIRAATQRYVLRRIIAMQCQSYDLDP